MLKMAIKGLHEKILNDYFKFWGATPKDNIEFLDKVIASYNKRRTVFVMIPGELLDKVPEGLCKPIKEEDKDQHYFFYLAT